MTGERGQSDPPTAFEMLEGVLLLITGAVVAAPMLPGFLLCVPVLVLIGFLVIGPLVAAAVLVAAAGAILALPHLLVRSIRGRRRRCPVSRGLDRSRSPAPAGPRVPAEAA